MKTTTVLCDICSERVAKYKCRFCGKDMCDNHIRNISIDYHKISYSSDIEKVVINFGSRGKLEPDKYICHDCAVRIKQRFKVLSEAQNKSEDANLSLPLIDELLKVFEKYAKIEVI